MVDAITLAVLQTCLYNEGLCNWLLLLLGIVVLRDLNTHAIGVVVPVVRSYFGASISPFAS